MTPDDVRSRLTAYLDDRMAPAEAREFLAWLESHPDAWKEAEAVRRVWALLGAYRDEPVPEGFADRVLAKAAAEAGADVVARPALTWLPGGRARALAAAAAIVAALGVGALLGRGLGTGATPPAVANPAVATLDALPSGVLDQLDGDTLVQLASLSDAEFSALLLADPQDLAPSGN